MEVLTGVTDLKKVKRDLVTGIFECSERGLIHATKWLAELNHSLKDVYLDTDEVTCNVPMSYQNNEHDVYMLCKSYFDLEEYDRASFFLKQCHTSVAKFLYFYSLYLSEEKKKIENLTDIPSDPIQHSCFKQLCNNMKKEYELGNLDGFGLYVYGVILKKLNLYRAAKDILLESIFKTPIHWETWLELSSLISDRSTLENLILPDHWIKKFFLAHMYLELQLINECLKLYYELQTLGFKRNRYIIAQIAVAVHHRRDADGAIAGFKQIIKDDPYCLDNMDTYSNLLYVKELKNELAYLAHQATKIDKYRLETCCIVGNYYSLRADHQKAVMYFHRALKLNPQYLSAWTLLGHEFMEMKNTNGAIHSYRQAIEVNKRDYRAWYGLGQTYEILKMPFYGLFYYKQAQMLRPCDSRMVLAVGEAYEKLDKTSEALKCYSKACHVGDIEGVALLRLALLYDKLGEYDNAAAAYIDFSMDGFGSEGRPELGTAYKFLMQYYLKRDKLNQANHYAQKCLQYDETKEEAKAILKIIAKRRNKIEENYMLIEDMNQTDPVVETNLQDMLSTSTSQLSPINLSLTSI